MDSNTETLGEREPFEKRSVPVEGHARNVSTITATATAVPPYPLGSDEVKRYMREVFSLDARRLQAVMAIVDNSEVKQRYYVFPPEYLIQSRSLTQITREYQEHAIALGQTVAQDCLQQAGMKPSDIDFLITVSCTGVMIPSLDAYLINNLGFRPNVRRLPITELGCAAGAVALSRAHEFVRAFPGTNVLVISVELTSLTFQRGDLSQANLVSCALFGDGAAAALVTGCEGIGLRILDTDSYLFPNTLDAMGFDLRDEGFHIVLSREVPELIRNHIKGLVERFLARHGLRQDQLSAFILHSGGRKLLAYIEEELGLDRGDLEPSWDVLRNYGNLSSATIFFVLRQWLTKRSCKAGDRGLLAAFGPGFSSELLLVRWA